MSDEKQLDRKLEDLRAFIEDNKDVEAFLEQSRGFTDSEVQHAQSSEKKAWKVAYAAGGLAFLAVAAVLGLTPLKTVVPPKVLMVDKATATVTELQTLEEVRVSIEEASTRKALNDFLLARENYTFDTAELNYYTAAAFMSAQLQTQWAAYWDDGNPNSPFKVYKNDVKVRININTITPSASKGVATVRFTKEIQRGNLTPLVTRHIATVTYKYVNSPTEEKLRRINPFGFQVTDYRVDPEIGGQPDVPAPDVPVAPPAAPPVPLTAPRVEPQPHTRGATQ
jgi:type IV secretion system protein VirB8